MNFFLDFLIYLVAFGLGSALTWLVARAFIPAHDADEARARLDSQTAEVSTK